MTPPELMEELTEEILLRFPPDNPASLLRAALVCKLWRCLVCGAAFRRRYLEFHHTTIPLLCVLYTKDGMSYSWEDILCIQQMPMAYFVPTTTSFRLARSAAGAGAGHDQSKFFVWHAIDARHGRVLLCRSDPSDLWQDDVLTVWDPVTDEQHQLPAAPSYIPWYSIHMWNAAVTCATAGGGLGGSCDHLDCHRGPFMVVLMHIIRTHNMYLSVYSSEATAWSKITVSASIFNFKPAPAILVRSAFYFMDHFNDRIVGYDMAIQKISTLRLPRRFHRQTQSIVLMTDDDGGLGFVANVNDKLELWSREDYGYADFVLTRVIDLRKVLPTGALIKNYSTQVNGFADGGARRVLFIRTADGLYSLEINSGQVRKFDNCCGDKDVVPYISFCTQPPGSR